MVDFTNPITKETVFETLTGRQNPDRVGVSGSMVESNVLHKYASYNYVLTLSSLTRAQMDNPDKIPSDPPYNIIARTGGIGDPNLSRFREDNQGDATVMERVFNKSSTQFNEKDIISEEQKVLSMGRDIYFNSCTMSSFPRPNEFRKHMNYTKIEMALEEPNGITFWAKCRAAAFNSGYLNHTTAPFLLTIEFKGFDSNGNPSSDVVPKRVYPIRLSRSSLRMNAGGTSYTVEAFPWTEFGAVNAFLFTRSKGDVGGGGGNLNGVLKIFADQLNNDIEDNEKGGGLRELADRYEITADDTIGKIESAKDNQFPVDGPLVNDYIFRRLVYQKNTSIAKILEDLVRQYKKYNDIEKIIKDRVEKFASNKGKISENDQYVDWFKIVTTVKEEKEFDRILKTHRRTIKFHIKEFKLHMLNFIKAGMGISVDYENAVRKVFNYIYTGENLDILDLNVEYNAGYYQPILRKQNPNFLKDLGLKAWRWTKSLFGAGTYEADELLPLSQYITTLTTESNTTQPDNDTTYVQQLADAQYDYLTNPQGDMVLVEMKIMGDPAFLGHDYAIPMKVGNNSTVVRAASVGRGLWDPQLGAYNFDNGEVMVKLNFRFPSDFDENEGLYKFNTEATPQFSGLYKVIRVENMFENGQFTQRLTMARCNNQRSVSKQLLTAGIETDGKDTSKRFIDYDPKPWTGTNTKPGTAGDIAGETAITE
jgi:hypothetical protein